MPKTKKTEGLTPKEELFCSNYTAIGEPTFSHKGKSALGAEYPASSAANTATRLLRRPDIQRRVCELHAANMARNLVSVDSVLANLAHDRLMAREKSDIAAAVRCDELEGKYLALFTDKQMIALPEQQQMDDHTKAEAIKLARLRLKEKYNLADTDSEKLNKDEDLSVEKTQNPPMTG